MKASEHNDFCIECGSRLTWGKFAYRQEICWTCFKAQVLRISSKLYSQRDKEIVTDLLNIAEEVYNANKKSGIDNLINIPEDMLQYINKQSWVNGGVQIILKFPNGYGASIINHDYSYGVELAVLGPNGHINYDTHITNDVLGHLDDASLRQVLIDIISLEPEDNE